MPARTAVKNRVEEYLSDCKGRNRKGEEVFDIPVRMLIIVSRSDSNPAEAVSVDVRNCPYNYGYSKNYCKASHPHADNIGDVTCPYVLSLPCGKSYLAEHKQERALVNKDLSKIASPKDNLLYPWRHLFE